MRPVPSRKPIGSEGFFDSLAATAPGKVFTYNSMNSFILSAAVRKITGAGLMEYPTPRLWGAAWHQKRILGALAHRN